MKHAQIKQQKPEGGRYDDCDTPPYAVNLLLRKNHPIRWAANRRIVLDPACGNGFILTAVRQLGLTAHGKDIKTGDDFLQSYGATGRVIITNPPYSGNLKAKFLAKCYELNVPFALLMPLEFIGTQAYYKTSLKYDKWCNLLIPSRRIDFGMPDKGWSAGGAQFPTAWYWWTGPSVPIIRLIDLPAEIKKDWKESTLA